MNKKSIPFLILAIPHALILLYTIIKKGKKTFGLLTIGIGAAYVFEYFVLNIFKMYRYYPKVFKNKWIDSVFGALLSQAVFVPIASTVLTSFKLGWKSRIIAAVFYGMIERLFIKWKIFEDHTWKTYFTVTAMPLYFYVIKKWWDGIKKGNNLYIWVSILFCYWINYTNVLYFSLALFNKYRFRVKIVRNKYWDHFISVPMYTLLSGILGTVSTIYVPKPFKMISVLIMHLIDQVLYRYRMIKPTSKKSLYALIPIHISMLLIGESFKKLIQSQYEEEGPECDTPKKLS